MIAVGSGFPDILKKHDTEIKKNASISLKFIEITHTLPRYLKCRESYADY